MGGKKENGQAHNSEEKDGYDARLLDHDVIFPSLIQSTHTHTRKSTFNEITNLRPDMSFLQVLNHSVGDSSQMTHVASPGPTFSSREIRGHKPTATETASMLYYAPLIKSDEKLKQLILNSVILLPGVQNPLHQATLLEKLHNTHRHKRRLDY